MRNEEIKSHFEDEAKEFDEIIKKIIPRYDEMIIALISAIPFEKNSGFKAIDLGCGTGSIAKSIKNNFPSAEITCVDIAKNMLETAKYKIGGKAKFILADFYNLEFPEKYDLIVSSLALHHLEDDNDKLNMYKKIFNALNENGIFINIDVVLGSNEDIQKAYMEKWQEFILKNVSRDEMTEKWLRSYYYEDRPTALTNHLRMLESCEFACVDVIYKYYNFAVYMAKR